MLYDADNKPITPEAPKPKTERPRWRDLYGWDAVVAERVVPGLKDIHGNPLKEQLPFPQFYVKQFTHEPKATVLGAPKRRGVASTWDPPKNLRQARRLFKTKPTRYVVWYDRSLRRVDKLMKKHLEGMTDEQRAEFIKQHIGDSNAKVTPAN